MIIILILSGDGLGTPSPKHPFDRQNDNSNLVGNLLIKARVAEPSAAITDKEGVVRPYGQPISLYTHGDVAGTQMGCFYLKRNAS